MVYTRQCKGPVCLCFHQMVYTRQCMGTLPRQMAVGGAGVARIEGKEERGEEVRKD